MEAVKSVQLIQPYCGSLVQLLPSDPKEREERKLRAGRLPSIQISARSQCDLELLSRLPRFVSPQQDLSEELV